MNNLVSVVITCYNHEKYVGQCIESVFNQSFQNIELIVINDGSSDLSGQIIEDLLKQSPFKDTIYLTQENIGICATRNRAIEMINGDFLLFVDSDNFLELNYIEKLLNKNKWKAHYYFGKFGQKIGVPLKWILPQNFYENLMKKYNKMD